jgi:hypothetical protein
VNKYGYDELPGGGFDAQHAPIEDVIKYLTVTLKKKWGDDEQTKQS